jgi:hypothetical protein
MQPQEFHLAGFQHDVTATVKRNGLAQLFLAVNRQGRGLLVFRTSLRLMLVADPTRARQEAEELVRIPDNIIWNMNHGVDMSDFLRKLVIFLFEQLRDEDFQTVQGASGGDDQWFLCMEFRMQLSIQING